MIDGGHIEDQVAGRALDALTPEEQAQVDSHVDTCPPCRQLLSEAQETAHMLALAAQPVRPPRHCWARLMAAIERDEFLSRPSTPRPRSLGWTRWAAAGAFALLMIGWNMRLEQEKALLQQGNAQLQQQLGSMRQDLARQNMIQELVIANPRPKPLNPQGGVPASAHGQMYMNAAGHDALLVVEGLQPAPAGKVYQIWVANDKAQQPMETFQVHQPREKLMMHAPVPLKNFKWVMITVEDAGGSKTPSKQTVLFGDL